MRVTVYLGSRCNLNCVYCHKECDAVEPEVSETFLDRLAQEKNLMIKFMGGEPTLYMDTVRKFIDRLPNARFALATNGVLLDKYIDYFREHKVFLCLSYDGTDTNLRGFDPFIKVINYPWLHVSCTVYHGNTDLKKIYNNFAQKEDIVGRPLHFYPHIMHVTNSVNDKYKLTKEDMDSLIYQIKAIMEEFYQHYALTGRALKKYFTLYSHMLRALQANYEQGETYCVNKNLIKVDVTGQAYSCQYIRDTKINDWRDIPVMDKCKTCGVYGMCGGACIKSAEHELECYYYKNLYTWFKEWYATKPLLKNMNPADFYPISEHKDYVYVFRCTFNNDLQNYTLDITGNTAVVKFNKHCVTIDTSKIPDGESAVVMRSKVTNEIKVVYNYKTFLEQFDMTPTEYATSYKEPAVIQIVNTTQGLFIKCYPGKEFTLRRDGNPLEYQIAEFSDIHKIDRKHSFFVFPHDCKIENGKITTIWRVMISSDYKAKLYVNYNSKSQRIREGLVKVTFDYRKDVPFYWGNKGCQYKGRAFYIERA